MLEFLLGRSAAVASQDNDNPDDGEGAAVRRLAEKLEFIQERLRTLHELSGVANKELRAVNEELQSISEELQIVNSELKLKLAAKRLIDLSHDAIFMWELDGNVIEWNRGSEELYGYKAEETIGVKKEVLLGTTVPGSSLTGLRETLLREGGWSGEVTQKAKDGRLLTVESRLLLQSLDGRRLVLESNRNINDRKEWEERQNLLLRELTHRVKNTLAIVQSIANQTLRHSGSREDFVDRFSGRLAALAGAHSLMVQSDWQGADFEALARVQLDPYASDGVARLKLQGPPITLPADLATPFGLVLHELAANAAKYGALARDEGSVSLTWSETRQGNGRMLKVVWQEKGGPPVKRNNRVGFGTALIEQGIPNAKVNREFNVAGFTCTIDLPIPDAMVPGAQMRE
jgi:two-component system CheB/CheR fusion protein